jgi:RNA polymerase sigma-70 factor (ECF subfamily)
VSDENCQEPDLLSAADHGKIDPATVAELYARYGVELQRFLVGLLRDSQLAADALQATFVKLAEHGHKTREESRKGWLFRVAYHEAMLLRRRQAIDDAALRRTAWDREFVGESAEAERSKQKRFSWFGRRSTNCRKQRVERMRVYEDKTFAAIAAELGIPLGTALGRMHGVDRRERNWKNSHNGSNAKT